MPKSGHGTLTIYTDVDTGGLSSGIKGITKSINKLTNSLKLTVGIAGFLTLAKSAVDAASDLQEYRNVAEVTFGSLIGKLDDLLDVSLESYGMSKLMATQAASGFMAMGNAAGIAKKESAEMAVGLTKYMADFASFYNLTHERARTALAAVYTGETETLKQYGIMLQEVNLQQYENTYGMGRSIKTMTAAEKVQLRYNYVLHVGADAIGDFARTSNNWSNQTRVLTERWKEFLVMLGNGLITVLTPAVRVLNELIDVTMRYAKTLGDALTVIFGIKWQDLQEQQLENAEAAETMADGQDAVAEATRNAAKSAKKALQPFDKLNNIQSASTSTSAVPELDIDDVTDKAVQSEEIISSEIDTIFKLGQHLAQTMQNILDSINWDTVYEKMTALGAGIAEFLNGALSVDALSSLTTTIANALNAAIKTALKFAEDFNWEELGNSIAESINAFFENFDGEQLAETLNKFVDGIKKALITAIENIDWEEIKEDIKKFIRTLDVDTITLFVGAIYIPKLAKLLLSAFGTALTGNLFKGGIAKFLAQVFSWDTIKNGGIVGKLIEAFKFFLAGAGTFSESIMAAFGTVGGVILGVVTVIGGAVTAIVNFVKMITDGFSWLNEILMVVGIALAAVGAVILGAPALVAGVIAAIVAALATAVVVIKDNWESVKSACITAWEAVKNFFIETWEVIKEAFNTAITAIGNFFVNLWEGIREVWTTVSEWFNTNVLTPVKTFFEEAVTAIAGFFTGLWEGIKSVWQTVSTWFNENVITPVVSFFEGLGKRLGQIFEGCWIIIQAVWKVVSEWFNTNVIQPVVKFFSDAWEKIKGFFSNAWEKIKSIWKSVSKWFSDNVIAPVVKFFSENVEKIKGFFKQLWENIKSVWKGASDWFGRTVIGPISGAFSSIANSISGFFTTAWTNIKNTWSTVVSWFSKNVISPFTSAWETAVKAIGGFFDGVWEGLVNGVVGAMNGMIGTIESALNWIIEGINGMMDGFNGLVEWAADKIGADWGGVDLINKVSLSRVKVPKLAQGAVIPPNKKFLAMLGDQKHGTNVEAPLDTIKQALIEALQSTNFGGNNDNGDIVIKIGEDEIFRAVRRQSDRYYNRTGQSAFNY